IESRRAACSAFLLRFGMAISSTRRKPDRSLRKRRGDSKECPGYAPRPSPLTRRSGRPSISTCGISESAGRAFFTPALLERVAGLYGVQPSIQFVQVVALVE